MKRFLCTLVFFLNASLSLEARSEVTAVELLDKYDKIMGPTNFESEMEMTSNREDGTSRTYGMKALKSGDDKFRIWFILPSAVSGQEILRIGDNSWLYLPNLKRSSRLANRDSFQGGDFNNSDILRVNYTKDFDGKIVPNEDPLTYKLELKSKNKDTSYDLIHLWMNKSNFMPVKGEYFGTSGKKLRSAEFTDVKEFSKSYMRPAKVVMKNEIVPARSSFLIIKKIKVDISPAPQKFIKDDLGKG
jgi:outer membrane lipoprotein-sorting protein